MKKTTNKKTNVDGSDTLSAIKRLGFVEDCVKRDLIIIFLGSLTSKSKRGVERQKLSYKQLKENGYL